MFSGCLSSMLMQLKVPFNQCTISKGGKYDPERHLTVRGKLHNGDSSLIFICSKIKPSDCNVHIWSLHAKSTLRKINPCETIKSPDKVVAVHINSTLMHWCPFVWKEFSHSALNKKGTVGNSEGEINWHASGVTVHSLPITGLAEHDKHSLSSTFH